MSTISTRLRASILVLLLAGVSGEVHARRSSPPHELAPDPTHCRIQRITDGDTVRCTDGRRIRLLLIDAPERDQAPFGGQATAFVRRLLPIGTTVRLEYDVQRRDRYGRDLAYIFIANGRMANEEIVRAGFAVVSVYPPNVRYVERMRAAAREAREARRGLWNGSAFDCLPSDHRRRRC